MTRHDDTQKHASDPVAQYFAERGVPDEVRRTGLAGIIAKWTAIAGTAARYDLTLDDWLNDVDLRDIIAGAVTAAPESERNTIREALDRADTLFRAATVATKRSMSGDAVASADNHDPHHQWWYFRRPANPGETMREDLAEAGIS
ncbi:MAG: hypothetical protein ABI229_02095 [Gemmatimonadaceae bacterium]